MNKKILLSVIVCVLQSSAAFLSALDFHVPGRTPSIDTEPGHARGGITAYKLEGADKKAAIEDVKRIAGQDNFISRVLLVITNYGESKNFYTITGQDGLTFGIKDFTGGSLTPLMTLIQERYPGEVEAAFGKEWGDRVLDKRWTGQWTNKAAERKGLEKNDKGLVTIREVRVGLDRILTAPQYRGAQLAQFRKETVEPALKSFRDRNYKLEFSLAALAGVANSFGGESLSGRLEAAEQRAKSRDEIKVMQEFVRSYVMYYSHTSEKINTANKLLKLGFSGQDVSTIDPDDLSHGGRRFRLAFIIFPWQGQKPFSGDLGEFDLRDEERLAERKPAVQISPPAAREEQVKGKIGEPPSSQTPSTAPNPPASSHATSVDLSTEPLSPSSKSETTIRSSASIEETSKSGDTLPASEHTKKWLESVRNMDLENSEYSFPKLDGKSSRMLKIKKDGKTVGSFLPPNSSGNPNSEIAYFNMARILGFEDIIRPAVPYKLGKRPLSEFRRLLESDHIEANRRNRDKIRNRDNILAWIKANPAELNGAVKADKPKSNRSYNEILSNGSPKKNHALMQHVQANNPMPDATGRMALADGSATTNALETARAWSILLSLDVIFGQSDRYSGSNITVNVDEGRKTFALFSTDNGGADLCSGSKQAAKNLGLFSRYDRDAVAIIERMTTFLKGGSNGFDGYSDPKAFVVDLGFYLEPTPEKSVQCLKENCDQFLKAVRKNEELFKSSAFFPARNLVQTKPTSNEGQAADQPLGTKKAAISQELFDAIARLDTTIFEAYNGHDVDRMMVMFTEDLEFYYDTGGMSKYERTKESLKSLFAKTPDIRRDLVKSSLEIYPVKDYGAIEIGEHRFCHKENDKDDCGTFKFVMIWRKTGESWKISRVINYGHQQRSF